MADGSSSDPSSAGPQDLSAQLRRASKRARRRAVKLARNPRAVALVRKPFAALPAPVRRMVRRRLRRWERQTNRWAMEQHPVIPIPPGRALAGTNPATLAPVVIVLPHTGDADAVDRIVDRIAQLQAASRGFAPLVVLSDLSFRAARRHGYLVEYLPPKDRDDRLATPEPWREARRQRLGAFQRWYAPERLILLPSLDEADGVEGVCAVLAATLDGLEAPVDP